MNGIYIHIPFCNKRCIYCDFYSTVNDETVRDNYVSALCQELELRAGYLPSREIDTLYIGGGTPSLLTGCQLGRIFQKVNDLFDLKPGAEITIEVNPDDVNPDFVTALKSLPVNRVSMGVQSFNDDVLQLLNRRHNSRQAVEAVHLLYNNGYRNLSIDLIYGLPGQTLQQWEADVDKALQMPVTHLSSYALSYEEGTVLKRWLDEGKISEADEELSLAMFTMLMDKAAAQGWEHYEISNFAKPDFRSRHNSGYWKGMLYLGCGPSAHSYNGNSRCWNQGDVKAYIKANGNVEKLQHSELLTEAMQSNEMIMTSLRTCEGLDLEAYQKRFGRMAMDKITKAAHSMIASGRLKLEGGFLKIPRNAIFLSDDIMSDLMDL